MYQKSESCEYFYCDKLTRLLNDRSLLADDSFMGSISTSGVHSRWWRQARSDFLGQPGWTAQTSEVPSAVTISQIQRDKCKLSSIQFILSQEAKKNGIPNIKQVSLNAALSSQSLLPTISKGFRETS